MACEVTRCKSWNCEEDNTIFGFVCPETADFDFSNWPQVIYWIAILTIRIGILTVCNDSLTG